MYFEANTHGHDYKVKVFEARTSWNVQLKKDEEPWVEHIISKDDFQMLNEAITFMFNNHSYLVDVVGKDTDYTVYTRGSFRSVKIYNDEMLLHESLKSGKGLGGGNSLDAGMPGKITKIMVTAGQEVKEGDPILIMEAMKMENEMRADRDCKVKTIHVKEGQTVESGAELIEFED
ncbi:MAG: acetyl-CoA carboxylase biotin carboxyl carrier protein subunit [Bdellovibrionaceae bacterium]|nr:acetyl-CoA carboxylase biotin carboxyl carrier protein subunit [Pseudobdellovibrionaceae bacterium]|tara:strand:- start:185507 stop:186031 length:525 start_codon:yes stop_codon:yes gene_type:complete